MGVPTLAIYIVGACYLLFLASGVLILLEAKSYIVVIVGSFIPIGLCLVMLLGSLDASADIIQYVGVFLDADWLVPGILLLTLETGPTGTTSLATVALGTYVLLVGGVLGMVCSFLERD